jgi:hypothetical protein
MNPATLFFAELNANVIFMLWIVAFGAAFFGAGIYVVSGRWAAKQPQRDAKAIARWEKNRRTGFSRFALRNSVPVFWGLLFAHAFYRGWRFSGRLALSPEEVINTGLLATAAGFVVAAANWFEIRRRAEEAHDRAARQQDERMA